MIGIINWNDIFLKHYLKWIKKIKPNTFNFSRSRKKWRDVEIVFKISYSQIQKLNLTISICLFFLFIIVYTILNENKGFILFFIVFFGIFTSYIRNFLYIELEKRKNKYFDDYRFILLNLSLVSRSFSGKQNITNYILKILSLTPYLGINITEKIDSVLNGGDIIRNFQDIQYYSTEFKDLLDELVVKGHFFDYSSITSQFDKKILEKFEIGIVKFKNHLQILIFLTLFFPILFFFFIIFYPVPLLDTIFVFFAFIFLEFYLIIKWRFLLSIFHQKRKNTKSLQLGDVYGFLKLLCNELRFFSPQYSLLRSLKKTSNRKIREIKNDTINSFNPITKFFSLLREKTQDHKVIIVIDSFSYILEMNSTLAENFFISINELLIEYEKLEKQKKMIISDIKSKTSTFKILSTINLSILSPFAFTFQNILSKFQDFLNSSSYFNPTSYQTFDLWYFLILPLFFLIVIISALNMMIFEKALKKSDVLFLILYIFSFFMVKSLIFSNIM